MSVLAYKRQSLTAGWTRVDLLLYLYDRAIASAESCVATADDEDTTQHSIHFLTLNKSILALHAGLKPDEDEVAFNVARLLHFVSQAIVTNDFQTAIRFLQNLRDGFAAVADEANQMERDGRIPPIPLDDTYRA